MDAEGEKTLTFILTVAGFVCCFALGFTSGLITGENDGWHRCQLEAVSKGHAEWEVDKNGKPVFHWKETPLTYPWKRGE